MNPDESLPFLPDDQVRHERRHPEQCGRDAEPRRPPLIPKPLLREQIGATPRAILPKGHLGVRDARPTMALHHPLIPDRHAHQQRAGDAEGDRQKNQPPRRPDFCDVAGGFTFTVTFGFG